MVLSAALTPEPVTETLASVVMQGCGAKSQQALDKAFRQAVEFHSGSVIVNQARVRNDHIVDTETLDYSAGRVAKYHIIDQTESSGQVCVTAEIWVERSRIGHRILGHNSTQQEFNGSQHSGQIASLQDERARGDRLLAHVIQDYPVRAYDIRSGTYSLTQNARRETILRVPYTLQLNPNFLVAMEDTFKQVLAPLDRNNIGSEPVMAVAISHPTSRPIGNRLTWLVNESPRAQVLQHGFSREPKIRLTLVNSQGQRLLQECWNPAIANGRGFVTHSDRHVRLYGNYIERSALELVLPAHAVAHINHIERLELDIVSDNMCS